MILSLLIRPDLRLHRSPDATCSTCLHKHLAHEHYRRGDDCGFANCGCSHFSAGPLHGSLVALRGLHAA